MRPAGLATMALSHCIENRKLFESSQMAKKIGRENSTHHPVRPLRTMLQIAIIALFAVVIVFLSSIQERQKLRRFLERGCAGFRWRRRFPQASKAEIREFLDIFVEAFGFKRSWRLSFAPDDQVMEDRKSVV